MKKQELKLSTKDFESLQRVLIFQFPLHFIWNVIKGVKTNFDITFHYNSLALPSTIARGTSGEFVHMFLFLFFYNSIVREVMMRR